MFTLLTVGNFEEFGFYNKPKSAEKFSSSGNDIKFQSKEALMLKAFVDIAG